MPCKCHKAGGKLQNRAQQEAPPPPKAAAKAQGRAAKTTENMECLWCLSDCTVWGLLGCRDGSGEEQGQIAPFLF